MTRGNEEVLARGGACRRVTAHQNFKWCVRARSVSESAVFWAIESRVSSAFQCYRRCCDQSSGTASPRVAVGPFGDESVSWQRDDRISDEGGAGDS